MTRKFLAWTAVLAYVMTGHLTAGYKHDFGREWLAARLVAIGFGRQLYDPSVQQRVLMDNLGSSTVQRLRIEGVGWLTYPPTQAILYAPLGWLGPMKAQWCVVQFSLLATLVAAVLMARLTASRITPSAALLSILPLPIFFCNIQLGQNAAFNLMLIAMGWLLLAEDRPFLAGIVWGLFAYKPTWAMAIFWVPLAVGRPRAYIGMLVGSAALIVPALICCGASSFEAWWGVARSVEAGYGSNWKWQLLRRDLTGLLAYLVDDSAASLMGAAGMIAVAIVSAIVWNLARGREFGGIPGALMLSAIVLTCPRFMYYDVLIAVLPFLVACAAWSRLSLVRRVTLLLLIVLFVAAFPAGLSRWPRFFPLETVSTVGLWIWCLCSAWDTGSRGFRRIATGSSTVPPADSSVVPAP